MCNNLLFSWGIDNSTANPCWEPDDATQGPVDAARRIVAKTLRLLQRL